MHHIILAGGGTAGHITPGVALVETLRWRRDDIRFTMVGCGRPIERRIAEQYGIDYRVVTAPQAPNWRLRSWYRLLVDCLVGWSQAKRFHRENPVDLVVGMGGFASLMMVGLAWKKRIPLILLEQNAVPGNVNRQSAADAEKIFLSFEGSEKYFGKRKADRFLNGVKSEKFVLSGCPVRQAFHDAYVVRQSNTLNEPKPQCAVSSADQVDCYDIVVLGGSGGAEALNRCVPRALKLAMRTLGDNDRHWRVLHQSGEREGAAESTRALYDELQLDATVEPFLDDLPERITDCKLAISRAGATTLAELAVAGLPGVLVPYPFAKDDHQRQNALQMADRGGFLVVDQRDFDSEDRFVERLASQLVRMFREKDMLRNMTDAARHSASPDAAERIADYIESVLDRQQIRNNNLR